MAEVCGSGAVPRWRSSTATSTTLAVRVAGAQHARGRWQVPPCCFPTLTGVSSAVSTCVMPPPSALTALTAYPPSPPSPPTSPPSPPLTAATSALTALTALTAAAATALTTTT